MTSWQDPGSNTIVVKIGGSTLGSHDTTLEDLVALQKDGQRLVVVHGGGNIISRWLEKQGVSPRFVRGLRVTDGDTLQVVVAVLAGLVNKDLVGAITTLGGRALGLSGLDGGLLEAEVKAPELGYVGEIVGVNLGPIQTALSGGYMPVIAPLAVNRGRSTEGEPLALNINADTVAGEVAAALSARNLVFLTDVEGVQNAAGEVIHHLSAPEAQGLIQEGSASGGMIPKLEACLKALAVGVQGHVVDGRKPHSLLGTLVGSKEGTIIG